MSEKKILIVDDENGVRESFKLVLSDHFPLILTEDHVQCLDVLKNSAENIGLIILDIHLPEVNGLDLLSQIKDKYPDIPVIMVTGYNSVETAKEATARGAQSYIIKPFKSKDLIETVGKFYIKK